MSKEATHQYSTLHTRLTPLILQQNMVLWNAKLKQEKDGITGSFFYFSHLPFTNIMFDFSRRCESYLVILAHVKQLNLCLISIKVKI